jgi:methyltransferase (TIGR00027 family)
MEPRPTAGPLEATARWTAAVRARESARPDRLFDDPWAAVLAGPEGMSWVDGRPPDSVLPIVLRARSFDDWLLRVAAEHSIRQVVLVAAGLDARAYRLAWPEGTNLFEIDRPAVLHHKAAVLDAAGARAACARHAVEADLTAGWGDALVAAGFDPTRPACWLVEGLLFYLSADATTHLLDEISRLSAIEAHLGFDVVNGLVLTSPWTRPWVEMQAAAGAPWIGTMDDPVGFLAGRGWSASLTQAGQSDANHGRWTLPELPTTMPDVPHSWLVTAERTA